jgi:hypothetical protein
MLVVLAVSFTTVMVGIWVSSHLGSCKCPVGTSQSFNSATLVLALNGVKYSGFAFGSEHGRLELMLLADVWRNYDKIWTGRGFFLFCFFSVPKLLRSYGHN